MTVKTKLDFDPGDIKAIKLTCEKCSQITAWNPVGKGKGIPASCPWCRTPWVNGTGIKRKLLEDLFDFIVQEAAEEKAEQDGHGRPLFTVSFEIEQPGNGDRTRP